MRTRKRFTLHDLLKPHWRSLSLAFGAVAIEALTDVLEPWPLKIILDHLLQQKPLPARLHPLVAWLGQDKTAVLNFAVAAVAVIAILGAVSSYAEKYLTTSVGQWVMHDLRRTVYRHIQRLSLAEHDEKRTGDLISRVTSDIEAIQSFVTTALLGIATNLLTLIGIMGVMLYLNWRFTLISLSVAPFLALVVYLFTSRIKKASRDVRRKEGELVSMVQEVFSSIRIVKAFAREDYEQRRFERESLENVELALLARSIKAKLSPAVEIVVACGTCLMLGYGARLVLAGKLTAGSLVVFLMYLGKMYKPMRELSKMTDTVSKADVGFERIREVLETESAVQDQPGARPAPRLKGRVDLENVSFGYSSEQPILKNVSLEIQPGQVAALVGPTGSGKSTIVSLIARFYDPVEGIVRIDGTDIRRFRMKSLREQISFVLQDTLLFHGPVWENIAYGRPEASREEIVRAAQLANADEFISKMPEGYDTIVGERGVSLSGGQRQRIAIARAIVRNTPILILDEPTAGLDALSEQTVFEALDRLMQNKTCIVIAHHLATIRRADIIFVVKDSEICERGTHDELLAHGGLYAELWETQFRQESTESRQPA